MERDRPDRVRRLREAHGLTQAELAERADEDQPPATVDTVAEDAGEPGGRTEPGPSPTTDPR